MRKLLSVGLVLAGLWLSGFGCSRARQAPETWQARADSIHQRLLTIDTHTDAPLAIQRLRSDMGVRGDPRQETGKVDFVRMQTGGLDAACFAAWVAQKELTPAGRAAARRTALERIEVTHRAVEQYPGLAELALSSADFQRIADSNKRALFIGLENGYALGTDLANLQAFYDRGVRYITLCHVNNDDICDSSTDSTALHGGLSPFGRQVVRAMNALGLIIDISHTSDQTVREVLELSRAPVIASHSCARALCDNPRNLSDSLLKALARKNGVIQVCLYSDYLKTPVPNPERTTALREFKSTWGDMDDLPPSRQAAARKAWRQLNRSFPRRLATVADAVDHIDHIVRVAGIDHVGIGSDFDGGGELADCRDVSALGQITRELVRRGYGEEAIGKIWGGNFLRVFRTVEQVARDLQTAPDETGN